MITAIFGKLSGGEFIGARTAVVLGGLSKPSLYKPAKFAKPK